MSQNTLKKIIKQLPIITKHHQKHLKIKFVFLHEPFLFNTKSSKNLKGPSVWAANKILQIPIPLAQIYKTSTKQL